MKTLQLRSIAKVIVRFSFLLPALMLAPVSAALGLSAEPVPALTAAAESLQTHQAALGLTQVIQEIDSLFDQQAYIKAETPDASDRFGYAVAVSGDTMVVGASQADLSTPFPDVAQAGSAYVFVRNGNDWELQAQLAASNPDQYDNFGWSVAIDGDTVVVGAPNERGNGTGGEEDDSLSSAGAAYVFERNGTTWAKQAYLKATLPAEDSYFGHAVAIDEGTIVVGAYREDLEESLTNQNAGAAYVFVKDSSGWAFQDRLYASNAEAWDYFGYSVAIDGNAVVVGAYGEDGNGSGGEADNSQSFSGAAYFFWWNKNTGKWSQKAYLKASNAEENDYFGRSVGVSGFTVVVGADGEDGNGTDGEEDNNTGSAGAVYVYEYISANWVQQAYLKASNAGELDVFGKSVAISGDRIVIGASGESSNGSGPGNDDESGAGAAYVFDRDEAAWIQQAFLKASNAEEEDYFGFAVDLHTSTIVVGAYSEDSDGTHPENNEAENAGAAYVYKNHLNYLPLINK